MKSTPLRYGAGMAARVEIELTGTTPLDAWAAALPPHTLVMSFVNTVRPSREIVELLLGAQADWEFASVEVGGHMAPLTHSHLVNPVIRAFITDSVPEAGLCQLSA